MPFISRAKRLKKRNDTSEEFDEETKQICEIPLLQDLANARTYVFEEQREESDTLMQCILDVNPSIKLREERNLNLDLWFVPNNESQNVLKNLEDSEIEKDSPFFCNDKCFRPVPSKTENIINSVSEKSSSSRNSTDKSVEIVHRLESSPLDNESDVFLDLSTKISCDSSLSHDHLGSIPNVIICDKTFEDAQTLQMEYNSVFESLNPSISTENSIANCEPSIISLTDNKINQQCSSSVESRHMMRKKRREILNKIRERKRQVIKTILDDDGANEHLRVQPIDLIEAIVREPPSESSRNEQSTVPKGGDDKHNPAFPNPLSKRSKQDQMFVQGGGEKKQKHDLPVKKEIVISHINDPSQLNRREDTLPTLSDVLLDSFNYYEDEHKDGRQIDPILSKEIMDKYTSIKSAEIHLLNKEKKSISETDAKRCNQHYASPQMPVEENASGNEVGLEDSEKHIEGRDSFSDEDCVLYHNRLTEQELLDLNEKWNNMIERAGKEYILSKERHIVWWDETDTIGHELHESQDFPKNFAVCSLFREKVKESETARNVMESFFQHYVCAGHDCMGSEILSVNSRSSF